MKVDLRWISRMTFLPNPTPTPTPNPNPDPDLRWMSRMTFLRCLARSRRKVSVRTRLRYLLTVRIRGLGSDPKPIPNQVAEEGEDQGAVTVLGVRVAERVELPP